MQVNGQLHALSAWRLGEESPVPIGVGRFVKENNFCPCWEWTRGSSVAHSIAKSLYRLRPPPPAPDSLLDTQCKFGARLRLSDFSGIASGNSPVQQMIC